ncbi:anti-sigma factor [Pelagibius sp.]|uniref:anti-sigma factor n=1 Tax=Pelagibius sp. TaxID=1931238 RepID=UPI003B503BDA
MRYDDPELQEALASQYVVGALQGPARRRFETLMRTRPALRNKVEAWEDRLTPLTEDTPPRQPPERVFRALRKRIDPQAEAERSSFWDSLAFWRPFGAAAAVLVVLVGGYAGFILSQPAQQQQQQIAATAPEQVLPSYVAVLEDAAEQPALVVTAYKGPWRLSVKPVRPLERPDAEVFQIWAVERGSGTIRPLLQLAGDDRAGRPLDEDAWNAVKTSESLMVTLESSGAAPAAPSGPVLFSGLCIALWESSST